MQMLKNGCQITSMIRVAVLWILILTSIIIIVGLYLGYYIIRYEQPEFIGFVLGIFGIAGLQTIIGIVGKVIQKNMENGKNEK
jgi:hypothetical protein